MVRLCFVWECMAQPCFYIYCTNVSSQWCAFGFADAGLAQVASSKSSSGCLIYNVPLISINIFNLFHVLLICISVVTAQRPSVLQSNQSIEIKRWSAASRSVAAIKGEKCTALLLVDLQNSYVGWLWCNCICINLKLLLAGKNIQQLMGKPRKRKSIRNQKGKIIKIPRAHVIARFIIINIKRDYLVQIDSF